MIEQLGRALVIGDRVETDEAVLVVQSVRARRPRKILIRRKPDAVKPIGDGETPDSKR